MYMSAVVKSPELCFVDSGAALQATVVFLPVFRLHPMRYLYQMPRHPTRPHVCVVADIISPHGIVQTVQPTSCCWFMGWKIRSLLTTVSAHSGKIISQDPESPRRSVLLPARTNNLGRTAETKTDQTRRNAVFERGPGPGDPLAREDRGRCETHTGGGRR